MGLLPTCLEEDTQQLQHAAPRRVEFVRQAFLHCPATGTDSQGQAHAHLGRSQEVNGCHHGLQTTSWPVSMEPQERPRGRTSIFDAAPVLSFIYVILLLKENSEIQCFFHLQIGTLRPREMK